MTDEAAPTPEQVPPAESAAPGPQPAAQDKPKRKNKPGAGAPKKLSRAVKEQIVTMLAHGLTEDKIAEILKVSRVTIWRAKQDREFCNAVLLTKDAADNEVVKALYLSAVGYSHPAEKIFCHDGEVIRVPYTKHFPPNPGSLTLWLINRRRADWRKEIQKEENREKQTPMIRLFSKIDGKEAARIKQVGNQTDVLLGPDFVAEVQEAEQNGHAPRSDTNGHP